VAEKIKPASPFSQTRKKKTQTPNPLFFPNSKPQSAEPRVTQQNQKQKKKSAISYINNPSEIRRDIVKSGET
jgi:hypothetical protein